MMALRFGTACAAIALTAGAWVAGASPVLAQQQAAMSAVAHPDQWPALPMKLKRDPKVEARVDALLAKPELQQTNSQQPGLQQSDVDATQITLPVEMIVRESSYDD